MRKHLKGKKLVLILSALALSLLLGLTALAEGADAANAADGVSLEEVSSQVVQEETESGTEAEPPTEEVLAEEPSAAENPATEESTLEEPASPAEQSAAEEEEPSGQPQEAAEPQSLAQDEGSSAVVTSYEELKTALGNDNGITDITLGGDITTNASGVSVHQNKPYVVIDGAGHTLTQYQSTNANYTIRVDNSSSNTRYVTVQNLHVAGGNQYGIVAIAESVKNVVLTHENVTYTGPQPAFNRSGTTRLIDSSYTLQAGGGVAIGELAETLHAELGGSLAVSASGTGNSLIWLTGSASTLTVLENADVSIDTSYYFVFTGGNIPDVTFQAGAGLRLVSRRYGFTYSDQRIGNFRMAEGSSLYIDLNTSESLAALRVAKLFQMEKGSSATILRTGTAGIPLRLTNANAQAVFNEPQRVFLYSTAGVPLRFTGAGTLSITTSALNVWQSTGWPLGEGLDTLPSHVWNKAGGELLTLTGRYNEAANSSLAHNLTSDDPVDTALNATNFNLEKNQLVVFGAMDLSIDSPLSTSPVLAGSTVPGAAVQTAYTLADGRGGKIGGQAGDTGTWSLAVTDGELALDSTVTASAAAGGLVMRQKATVLDGSLYRLAFLSVPRVIGFGSVPVPGEPTVVGRQDNFALSVSDTRLSPSPWRVDASLAQPLSATVAGRLTQLPGAVVFQKDGAATPLNEAPMTVYRQSSGAAGSYDILWDEGEGVLLSLTPGQVYSGVDYTATIHWSLVLFIYGTKIYRLVQGLSSRIPRALNWFRT